MSRSKTFERLLFTDQETDIKATQSNKIQTAWIYSNTHTHTPALTHILAYTDIHAHTRANIHIHAHTHAHTYTRTRIHMLAHRK